MGRTFGEIIHALDNHPDILSYTFADGSSMWLALRPHLRFMDMESISGDTTGDKEQIKKGKFELIKNIAHAFLHSPFLKPGIPEIISIANYEGNPKLPNRMTEFLKEFPEIKSIQLLYSPRNLRFINQKNTASFDFFYYSSLLHYGFRKLLGAGINTSNVQRFMDFLKTESGLILSEKNWLNAQEMLVHAEKIVLNYRRLLNKYFTQNRPKLIICSEGNNGDWKHNILFSVAHKLGIPTAEVQHGTTGIGLKYGEKLIQKDEFIKQKSDYFFSFGPYHCTKVNAVPHCIPMGHYVLEKAKNRRENVNQSTTKRILIVCEGLPATSVDNGFVRTLQEGFNKYRGDIELIIRLHPSEKPSDKYAGLAGKLKWRYSEKQTEDIYQLVQDCDVVIGHISTVLFEALYFKKPVLIYRDAVSNENLPKSLGQWFSTGEELQVRLAELSQNTDIEYNRNDFWADGTIGANFRKFWQTI